MLSVQIEHPAVKIIVQASKTQEQEVGDGTNFVIILAGALLEQAEHLLKMVRVKHRFFKLFSLLIDLIGVFL